MFFKSYSYKFKINMSYYTNYLTANIILKTFRFKIHMKKIDFQIFSIKYLVLYTSDIDEDIRTEKQI